MNPLSLLLSGLGLLLLGLLFVLGIDDAPEAGSARSELAKGYAANACALVGAGLVVVAAFLRATQPRLPGPPSIDHYS